MMRRAIVVLLGALTLLVGIAQEARADDAAANKLEIGTLAPKSSPWGKVFSLWEKAVSAKSGGKLVL